MQNMTNSEIEEIEYKPTAADKIREGVKRRYVYKPLLVSHEWTREQHDAHTQKIREEIALFPELANLYK
jgi:hypothetical protein